MTDKTPEPPPTPSAKELELAGKLATLQSQIDAQNKKPPRRQPAPAPADQTQKTPQQQLEDFANSKAREVEVLRMAAQYGLTEEELLEQGEFGNPTELRLTAQLLSQEKKQKALDESIAEQKKLVEDLKKSKEAGDEVDTEGQPDAGGRTRRVAREQKATQLREEAKKLGRTPEARWKLLESIKTDPGKQMRTSQFDEE